MSSDKTLPVPDVELDARGLFCPEPVMMLHREIRQMSAGQVLELVATDPSTTRDVPKFCMFLGHALIHEEESNGEFRFLLRKTG